MNEVEFRNWLIIRSVKSKVADDTILRMKGIERKIENCDIDKQYKINHCDYLLKLFLDMGNNKEMKKWRNHQ